ncbi:MAG: hypothetical protein AB7G93_12240 [Bdellovibrionales bacterium]
MCNSGYYLQNGSCIFNLASQLPKPYFILTEIFKTSYSDTAMDGDVGYFDFTSSPGNVIYNYFHYRLADNSSGITDGTLHPYLGSNSCSPGLFRYPTYSSFYSSTGTLTSASSSSFSVSFGSVIHTWTLIDSVNGIYDLTAMSGGGVVRFLGRGIFSDQIRTTNISLSQLKNYYSGYVIQNEATGNVLSSWSAFPYITYYTSLSPSVYRTAGNSNVYGYLYAINDGHSIWEQSSLVLNAGSYKSMFWAHGGHIYQQTDCFSETDAIGGHKYVYFGAWNNATGNIDKIVYLEYSYEADGVPIVSIGALY